MMRGAAARAGLFGACAVLGACVLSCERCGEERRVALTPTAERVRLTSGTGQDFELTQRQLRREPGPSGFEHWTLVADRGAAGGPMRALVVRFHVPADRGRSTQISPEGSTATVRFLEQGVLNEASMVLREGTLHEPERGAPTLQLNLAKRFAVDRAGHPHAPTLPAELRVTVALPQ